MIIKNKQTTKEINEASKPLIENFKPSECSRPALMNKAQDCIFFGLQNSSNLYHDNNSIKIRLNDC